MRVAILHQGCVPIYRRAFLDRLARIPGHNYVVYHGEPEPGSGVLAASPPFAFDHVPVRNRFLRILGRSLVYQPVLRSVLTGDFDALVIGHEVKYFVNIVLLLWFRLCGKPVLLWGFGRNPDLTGKQGLLRALLARLVPVAQRAMLLGATDFMAYTASGARHAAAAGMPEERISILNNTIDISEEISAYERAQALDRAELRRSFGVAPGAVLFAFVGRLMPGKRVEDLIEAAKCLRREPGPPVEVMIVGGGPEESRLKARAAGAEWCHFLGPVQASEPLSRIFRASDAIVIPGYVGLAVNHAFAHGLPVITRESDLHSPEFDYLTDGENGLVLPTAEGLADGLRRFAVSPDLRRKLAAGALESRAGLDLQRMVDAFDCGVCRAVMRSTRGRLSAVRRPDPPGGPA